MHISLHFLADNFTLVLNGVDVWDYEYSFCMLRTMMLFDSCKNHGGVVSVDSSLFALNGLSSLKLFYA